MDNCPYLSECSCPIMDGIDIDNYGDPCVAGGILAADIAAMGCQRRLCQRNDVPTPICDCP